MLRSALMLAAVILLIPAAQAQTSIAQTDQTLTQTWDSDEPASSSTTTGQRKDLPFPDMMKTFEFTTQEWQ